MAIPSISLLGQTSLKAAKAGIATAGHNIANAGTEGYTRQRANIVTNEPTGSMSNGVQVSRIERVNDEFVEKQIRTAQRDLSHFEEKDVALSQIEQVFNEMGDQGLNRSISNFFNEFRKLSDHPENLSFRNSVKEVGQTMVNGFRGVRKDLANVVSYLDSRVEACVSEINGLSKEITELNLKIHAIETEVKGSPPNDLLDKRDLALKKLGSYMEIGAFKDNAGSVAVDLKGSGPLIAGPRTQLLSTARSPADTQGKPEGSLDVLSEGSLGGVITHQLRGGRLGALLDTRDHLVSSVLGQLDGLAFGIAEAVNQEHSEGYSLAGETGILFFEPVNEQGAAGSLSLSAAVRDDVGNIAVAAEPDAPGDSRVGVAISKLQSLRFLGDGAYTVDDLYNSIVSDVGSRASQNKFTMNREKDMVTQLNRVRDQISGVSVDEETTHLLEFQHSFEASAKLIQIADEMLRTILNLKRD
jgi:flagellar hook-associated protein 1 FlgK